MNLHSFSLKTDCTNKFPIPKLSENSPFQVSTSTHDDRNNYRVTFSFIQNPGNSLQNTVIMKYGELRFIHMKNRLTNKFSIPKLSENSSTHDDRNNYQVIFTFIEKPGNSLKNTVMMKHDKMDCTSKFSIPKLSENSSFQVSNSTHDDRNNYQVIFTSIENTGNLLQNTISMKYDEIIFIVINN